MYGWHHNEWSKGACHGIMKRFPMWATALTGRVVQTTPAVARPYVVQLPVNALYTHDDVNTHNKFLI